MGELYDFTEFKLHQLIEYADSIARPDIATQLSDALDKYLMDEIHIEFVDGWPVAYQLNEQLSESDTDT